MRWLGIAALAVWFAAAATGSAVAQQPVVEELRGAIRGVRERVMETVTAKLVATQESRLQFVAEVLFYLSLGGVLLLFMPVFLASKYPGQLGTLFKYSALAMVTFVIAVNLFAGVPRATPRIPFR